MRFILTLTMIINPVLFGISSSHANRTCIAIYGFTSHINSDGMPSKCDCDYFEYNLYLYNDMTFSYVFQKGRLEPKYETQTGNWETKNMHLILSVTKRYYVDLQGEKEQEKCLQLVEFEIDNKALCCRTANICLTKRQGVGINDLFLKFK